MEMMMVWPIAEGLSRYDSANHPPVLDSQGSGVERKREKGRH